MFIDQNHSDAFVDFPMQEPKYGMTVLCQKCKGHGGWNLKLNSYPLWERENTPENRHNFSHFRAGCDNCQGYGFIRPDQAEKCVEHDWKYIGAVGKCLHKYVCTRCNGDWIVDSSD